MRGENYGRELRLGLGRRERGEAYEGNEGRTVGKGEKSVGTKVSGKTEGRRGTEEERERKGIGVRERRRKLRKGNVEGRC